MRERNDLRWRGLALHFGRSAKPMLFVEPDPRWPGMFRIRHCNGFLSDIVNLTRAKDAAESIVLAEVNDPQCRETPEAVPLVRFPRQGLSDQGAARFESVLARGRPAFVREVA